jgi:hypothetical protein
VRAALVALLLVNLTACGGGSGNGSPSPPSNPPPDPGSSDPCASVAAEALQAGGVATGAKTGHVDGDPRWRVLDALWTHRQGRLHRLAIQPTGPLAATGTDIGDIAVLQDEGDLILPANTFDLKGTGIRFTRNSAGGYDARSIDATFRATLGTRLALGDDDSSRSDVPFSFPFYAGTERTAFVNSDGNVTFREADNASTERNVARVLAGAPRVAPFFADLDPTTGGGVFVNATPEQYTVTWCRVRGFDSPEATTVQTTLLPDGTVEMKFSSAITLQDVVVALSPGRTGDFQPVDLSAAGPVPGGAGATGERFADQPQLDAVALSQAFYRSHPDAYDQLIIWTDTRVIQDAFAFEVTIANEIQGIGLDRFDFSRDFGSSGRLRSYAVMDFLGKYPDDPGQSFLGENSTVSVLGHEVGHRWLAYMEFRDHTGQQSNALLGRADVHWSFFLDSDASVMEGNDIEDLGGGSFRTTAAVRRFSRLDQYAMGLVPPSDVPPFFYVADPVNMSEQKDRESAPDVGVTFNGTRRDVLIEDVIAVNGPRVPASTEAPRIHRQAFIYVVGRGRTAAAAQVAKVDRIRREWVSFFGTATEDRMRAETGLQQ